MARFRLIDGLRAVAAAMVLLTHVAFWTGTSHLDFVGGLLARADAGVAVFFAISAFLLLRPWIRAASTDEAEHPSVGTYAVRRLVRIMPAYWLALGAVLLVAALLPDRTGGTGGPLKVLVHGLLLQGYSTDDYQAFSQTWSLTTEMTFYALVPVIGWGLGRLARSGHAYRLVGATSIVGVMAQGVAAWCTRSGADAIGGVLSVSVLGHLAWFGAGAALALGSLGITPRVGERIREGWRVVGESPITLIAVAGVVYLLASSSLAGPRGLQVPTVSEAIVKEVLYTLFAFCLLCAAQRRPGSPAATAVAASPATRWIGDISYGVFLWHVLILQVLYAMTGWPLFSGGFWWMLCAVTSLTILLAWASASWLEKPLLTWIHRRTRMPSPPPRPAPAGRS